MTATHKDFYFLSEFLARKLYHPDGSCLGRVVDLVAEKVEPYPVVTGLMIRRRPPSPSGRMSSSFSPAIRRSTTWSWQTRRPLSNPEKT